MSISITAFSQHDWHLVVNDQSMAIFGLIIPTLISLTCVIFYFKEVVAAAKMFWILLSISSVLNLVFLYHQEAHGWNRTNGIHLLPVFIFSFLQFSTKNIVRPPVMSPIVAFSIMWISLAVFDVIGSYIFRLQCFPSASLFEIVGGDGMLDALFSMPVFVAVQAYILWRIQLRSATPY